MVVISFDAEPELVRAVFRGDLGDVQQAIQERADVNYQDSHQRSPLHVAAFCDKGDIADTLLLNGARINAKDVQMCTPLHIACQQGNVSVVAVLMQHQCDISARDKLWQTPLHACAVSGAVDCAEFLLAVLGTVNTADRAGMSALHHAALHGHTELVRTLLEMGAPVNAHDKRDRRPLHLAAHSDHADIVRMLIGRQADVNVRDKKMYTPLHAAAACGRDDAVAVLLAAPDVELEAPNNTASTPLHVAAVNGQLGALRSLLAAGANVHAQNAAGQTALHLAAAASRGLDCVKLLLDRGGDPTSAALDGTTPLHLTAVHGRFQRARLLLQRGAAVDAVDARGCMPIHLAAANGHDVLLKTLVENKADANSCGPHGMTPLHLSAVNGYTTCVNQLLDMGVNIHAADALGRTTLHLAAYRGSQESASRLLALGAELRVKDQLGRQPLHYAAVQAHQEMVVTLMVSGSEVSTADTMGRTPLFYAAAADVDGRVVRFLLQRGADATRLDVAGFSALHLAAASGHRAGLDILLDMRGARAVVSPVAEGPTCRQPTPLHLAAYHGHLTNLINLMAVMDNVTVRDAGGRTPLHLAAARGNSSCVKSLLEQKAELDVSDESGRTPLLAAANAVQTDCVRLMIQHELARCQQKAPTPVEFCRPLTEARVEVSPEFDKFINHRDAAGRSALYVAMETRNAELVTLLLNHGADPAAKDNEGRTPLLRGVVAGAMECVAALLCFADCKPMLQDRRGKSALHLAAAEGHVEILGTLLEALPRGAADAHLDRQHCTPLHWACFGGHEACVEILLHFSSSTSLHGALFSPLHAAVYADSKDCLAPLLCRFGASALSASDRRGRTPLHVAAERNSTCCLARLLKERPALNTVDNDDRTPMMVAAAAGHARVVDSLLGAGGDAWHRDTGGSTALHAACAGRHSAAALLLVKRTSSPANLNITDCRLQTPLHIAARLGLVDITEALVSAGASLSREDEMGYTPALAIAPTPAHADCLALLMAVGGVTVRSSTSRRFSELMQKSRPSEDFSSSNLHPRRILEATTSFAASEYSDNSFNSDSEFY